jgi:uncharacterized protein (DUF1810 family)
MPSAIGYRTYDLKRFSFAQRPVIRSAETAVEAIPTEIDRFHLCLPCRRSPRRAPRRYAVSESREVSQKIEGKGSEGVLRCSRRR